MPGLPRRVRTRRQPLGKPMREIEPALASLAGVGMGIAFDRWLLPALVDVWIDRLRRYAR